MKKQKNSKTRWHRLLGRMLEEILPPVGIEVYTEFPVMSEPPKSDILLLRKENPVWTPEQSELIPDGIRGTKASHILLEFKYSESVTVQSFRQAVGYDFFYKQSKGLADRQAQTFLISAKKTDKKTLEKFGYSQSNNKGVYRSCNPMLESLPLISLNELSNRPHNAYIRCFASRMREKQEAFRLLKEKNPASFSEKFLWFMQGLWNHWFYMGGDDMKYELTSDQVMEIGKMWGDIYLSVIPVEKRLAGLKPEDRLAGLKPEDRLAGLSVKEIEEYLRKIKSRKKRTR